MIVLNLIELPLSHHLHGFSWSFRKSWMEWDSLKTWLGALQTCKQKPLLWWLLSTNQTENCKRILSIIELCVNITDKNKPYWNNIWIYGAFYTEKKYSFCPSNPPPILNQPLLPGDELFFHGCNAFKHNSCHWSIWDWPFSTSVSKGEGSQSKVPVKD